MQRTNLESESIKEKIKENQEKIKLNKQLPYLVGNIVEVCFFGILKRIIFLSKSLVYEFRFFFVASQGRTFSVYIKYMKCVFIILNSNLYSSSNWNSTSTQGSAWRNFTLFNLEVDFGESMVVDIMK